MSESGYRTLYRIVLHNPPGLEDMLSHRARGIAPRQRDTETLRLMDGISLYNTLQQARNQAAGHPWQGQGFIAELRIPNDAPVQIERTTSSRGHYTLWGNPDDILGYVSRVLPIRDSHTGET